MRAPRQEQRLIERNAALPLRDDGGLRLVVVADTHSVPHPATAQRIQEQRPDAILHAGDIGALAVRGDLAKLAANQLKMHHVDCETGERWEPESAVVEVRLRN